ncbi:MAG: gliding motility-associated C-terminal domain-containing protein [Candidatus Latescibacterota bacterium]|jgi:hypothetical protein
MRGKAGVAVLFLALAGGVEAQDAYVFRGDQVHVDMASHWRNWVCQNSMVRDLAVPIDSSGLYDITSAGIKPKYFPRRKNYVLDREEYTYIDGIRYEGVVVRGNIAARSNDGLVDLVGDGDVRTYWEPASSDMSNLGLRNWTMELDLGRAVWADSIVVLFPPVEGQEEVAVPVIPTEAVSLSDLTNDLRATVSAFARRAALDSLVASEALLSEAGDTLVREGDLLLRAGQQLPTSLESIRRLNRLGITSILVRGLDEAGDVPKLFAVEVSMGKQAGSTSSKSYLFTVVGRASATGDRRRFVFPLEPLDKADFDGDGFPDMSGTFVHYVRFSIFDSDFDQKQHMGDGPEGQLAYEQLSSERRGLKVYQRLTAGGILKKINPLLDDAGKVLKSDEAIWLELPEAARGPIKYFMRELPRVADVQVWGQGPNVAYRPERRAGGSYEDGGNGAPWLATDGVYITKWLGQAWDRKYSTGSGGQDQYVTGTMWLDLGASFWVDQIDFGAITTYETSNEGALYGLSFLGSDGTALRPLSMANTTDFYQTEFGLNWSDLASENHKNNRTYFNRIIEETFPLRKLRFFQIRNDDPTAEASGVYGAMGYFNEVQMFGEGYPAEVSVTSPPIVLIPGVTVAEAATVRQRRVLARIHWESEAVVHSTDEATDQDLEVAEPLELRPEVTLRLRTRTSDTIDSLFTYYEVSGLGTTSIVRKEIDEAGYLGLNALWDEYDTWTNMPATRTLTLKTHQTRRDDDGDTRIDEDPMDGLDNDGDKLIDEDGLTGDIGGPRKGTITLKQHQNKTDDDGDGALDEDLADGKDNDGDFLIDEDGKKKVAPRQKGEEVITAYFAGWSPWSEPYTPTGQGNVAPITSPSPRKFLQVRADIVSTDPAITARLKRLQIDLAPPVSTELAGELAVVGAERQGRPVSDLEIAAADYSPPVEIPPLKEQAFAYFIRAAGPDPTVPSVAEGFNELLFITPASARLTGVRLGQAKVDELTGVRRATQSRFLTYFERTGPDSLFRDPQGRLLQVENRGDSLLLRFPTSLNKGYGEEENALVEVQFTTQAMRAGVEFAAYIRDSMAEDLGFQRIESEDRDATELVDSRTARPTIEQTGRILDQIQVPSVFTPNGDGVNDGLDISFSVLRLREDRPVKVEFFDLVGRRVGQAESTGGSIEAQSGVLSFTWDGRDADDRLVPPGVYLCRITLAADQDEIAVGRVVSVVY